VANFHLGDSAVINPASNLPTQFRQNLSMHESGHDTQDAVHLHETYIPKGRGNLSKQMSAKF
jgi:hypothetical protein